MTKTPVKFQRNRHKTIGGVAHTRYSLSIYFDIYTEAYKLLAEKVTKKNLSIKRIFKFLVEYGFISSSAVENIYIS